MSKRLTRKEIKHDIRHDEVQEALVTTWDRILQNQRLVVGVLVGLFVLAAAASGLAAFMDSQKRAASEALADAIKIAGAPIVEDGAKPDDPLQPTFASEADRAARAKTALGEVGSGVAEDVAELYLAGMAARDGDTAEARRIWEGFLKSHKDHLLAASVRLNLIQLDRAEGKAQEVADKLRAELASSTRTLPEDVVLFELAQTLEELGQDEEARDQYQRILDDFPESPYATEARRKTVDS